jgi:hypothetical protein
MLTRKYAKQPFSFVQDLIHFQVLLLKRSNKNQFLFFRWNNELCTWLPQLFCIHWCSVPRKACCCHCGMCVHVLFSKHVIIEYWRHKLLIFEVVSLLLLKYFAISFRWNFVVDLCAGALVPFLHLLVGSLINTWRASFFYFWNAMN